MKHFIAILTVGLVLSLLGGCIGTDLVDDVTNSQLTVTINPPDDSSLEVGETLQLTALVENVPGSTDEVSLRWTSSRPEVLSVDETGLVTALTEGTAEITVSVNNVTSDPYPLAVGEAVVVPPPAATARTGTLQGQGGYTASGTVTLSEDEDGNVVLTTSDDFSVSLALGTFLYLSNSESGAATATDGLEVADVSEATTGAQTFNVTQVDASVGLDTYRYVVVLCKPARLTFGTAELN